MTSGAKMAIGGTMAFVLAVGAELLYLQHERNKPMKVAAPVENKIDADDLVFLKKERPSSLADLKDLYGKTVWVSAGGQMEYYPYAGHRADYTKAAGTLLGVEPMVIQDAFEQTALKQATYRIPHGDRWVLLEFTLPKSSDPATEYAVPVGYQEGKDFTFYTDELFFYDDPHELYKHWGSAVWNAVDSHDVILGMSEHQVQMALGQVSKSVSNEYGNRMVVYANLGKPMAVTFVKDHATAFRPDQGF
jgi:hypothetical protein